MSGNQLTNKKMNTKAYRHGEIAFIEIDELPSGLTPEKTNNIIVKGSNGNSHTFKGGKIYFYKKGDYIIGCLEAKNTILYHAEHGKGKGELRTAKLPDGIYEIRKQVEYVDGELKPVID